MQDEHGGLMWQLQFSDLVKQITPVQPFRPQASPSSTPSCVCAISLSLSPLKFVNQPHDRASLVPVFLAFEKSF